MDFVEIKTPLTISQVDNIYWLGRYSERVLTTLRIFIDVYDSHLDTTFDWASYCEKLDIYNGFSSLQDFCRRYAFDRSYQSSIISSLQRAYDNAIMLRKTIGSEALSYIELALQNMNEAETSDAPVLNFQKVLDCIMAFRGCVFDTIMDRNIRSILSCGFGVERLDMYLRLGIEQDKILFECKRLAESLAVTDVPCDKLQIQKIYGELCQVESVMDEADKMLLLQLIDSLFVFE